jgi:hypothetical protein
VDAALVDHASNFFFQFHEHIVPVPGGAVAAQAELFLVHGLFQRGADEVVARRVIVETLQRV